MRSYIHIATVTGCMIPGIRQGVPTFKKNFIFFPGERILLPEFMLSTVQVTAWEMADYQGEVCSAPLGFVPAYSRP